MTLHSPALTLLQRDVLFWVALCCLLLLFFPVFGLLSPQEGMLASENRKVAPFPSTRTVDDWKAFPKAFDAYFADHFAFRQALTSAHHRLLVGVFHRAPSHKVLLAQKGWLFLQAPQGNAIDVYHRNIKPFSMVEVESIHAELTRRRQWVESWGGKALFIVIPEKQTIYPEYLPDFFQKQANVVSRYDQWEGIFKEDSSLYHIDLRPTLRGAKKEGLLYFCGDSHWNSNGAYIGYRELVNRLQQWFPEIKLAPLPEKPIPRAYRGDLARLLSVGDWFDEVDLFDYSDSVGGVFMKCAKPVPPTSGSQPIPQKSKPMVYECNDQKLPSAVLVRDSMSDRLLQWLPDNFRRLVVMYNWYPAASIIESEKPDVVIFENVERSLDQFFSVNLEQDDVSKRWEFSWERRHEGGEP